MKILSIFILFVSMVSLTACKEFSKDVGDASKTLAKGVGDAGNSLVKAIEDGFDKHTDK